MYYSYQNFGNTQNDDAVISQLVKCNSKFYRQDINLNNTIIEKNVSIGDYCSIGSNNIIRNTLMKNNVRIHFLSILIKQKNIDL